jgi:outer membrane protein TolC
MQSRALSFPSALLAVPAITALLAVSSIAGVATAQPPPAPKAGTPGAPGTPGATTAAGAAGALGASGMSTVPAPPTIVINDDMLTPVPAAPKVLSNWKEALGFITSRSTTLATAVQEVVRAEGNARIALAQALPTITGTVSVTGQLITPAPSVATTLPVTVGGQTGSITLPAGGSAPNPIIVGSVTAVQPIIAPRAWYGIRTGSMGVTSAKYAVEDQKRTIFTSVASSIITVFTAERTAETNRISLRSALELVDLTQRQFKLGTATRLDVLRAQQNAATARATLVSGDEALRQAREALGLALGFPEAYGVPASLSLNEIESTLRGICAPGPLEERADIRKAKNDIAIAKRGITDVWLQFAPTAVLTSTASISNVASSIAVSGPPSDHTGSWSIGGVLSIPIWDGGVRYGNLKIAKAQAEETRIALEAALRTATIQVAQSLRGVSVADTERTVSESNRDLARDLAKLTMSSYQLGTATNFDLVNTEQVWRAAELDLIVKEFNVIQAKLAAVLATSNCTY